VAPPPKKEKKEEEEKEVVEDEAPTSPEKRTPPLASCEKNFQHQGSLIGRKIEGTAVKIGLTQPPWLERNCQQSAG